MNPERTTTHVNIIYKSIICDVVGMFTDEDGMQYTELLAVSGLGGFQFIIHQGGPQAYAQA